MVKIITFSQDDQIELCLVCFIIFILLVFTNEITDYFAHSLKILIKLFFDVTYNNENAIVLPCIFVKCFRTYGNKIRKKTVQNIIIS